MLRTGEPLLASPAVFSDMVDRGEVEMVGSPSVDWLGVPLKKQGQAFGVLVVQSYDPAVRFTEADKDILTFVSHQIAAALERKRAEARIEHLAYHDLLTSLPNRRLLLDRLDLALAQARRDKTQIAVLFLDLDRFKVINDSLGHTVGDEVLRAVAGRLKNHVRKGDTVARIGGDEFTAVIRNVHHPVDTAKVAEILQSALREPLIAGGRELFVTASIGISIYPNDGADVETLLKNADTALHRAKEHGLDSFRLFTAAMNAEAVQRLRLESELRRALQRGELFVHYQPIVDLATGTIQVLEALMRWKHPEHGLIAPSEFIPIAERTGLLASLGPWVLKTACAQAKTWERAGHPVSVAVNISPRQLHHVDLLRYVVEALDEAGLPAVTAGARDHREQRHAEPGGDHPDPQRAQVARRPRLHRRLRDGLLLAQPAPAASHRHPQDRPLVRPGHQHRPRGRRHRHRHHHARALAEAQRGGGRRRDAGAARVPRPAPVRPRAGLPAQPPGGRPDDLAALLDGHQAARWRTGA